MCPRAIDENGLDPETELVSRSRSSKETAAD